jgi:hypothetical protein
LIEAEDNKGWTPLHFAVSHFNLLSGEDKSGIKHVKDLLLRGASVKHKSHDGLMPIDRIWEMPEKKKEMRTLLE